MNLIPCSENCLHQKDGYCGCDQAGKIYKNAAHPQVECLYYTQLPVRGRQLPLQDTEGLADI